MIFQRILLTAILLVLTSLANAETFRLRIPTIVNKGSLPVEQVFNGFGCDGKNISPELVWQGAPKSTKSFAITVYDPDAPTGSGWWHWVVVNIPANVTKLPSGAGSLDGKDLPAQAKQVRTDFGIPGFGGACPPKGDKPHRYVFTIYALKVPGMDLPDNATAALAGFMIHSNKIAQAHLTAFYGR